MSHKRHMAEVTQAELTESRPHAVFINDPRYDKPAIRLRAYGGIVTYTIYPDDTVDVYLDEALANDPVLRAKYIHMPVGYAADDHPEESDVDEAAD